MNDDDGLYRICIELAGGDIASFNNATTEMVRTLTSRFLARNPEPDGRDGLGIVAAAGVHFWPWDEIRGYTVLRMAALNEVELAPHFRRITEVVDD